MLVLSRQIGESIIIDDDIKIQVLQVNGDTVKIGIEAPRKKAIYREELYLEIQAENQNAGSADTQDLKDFSDKLKSKKSEKTTPADVIED
ncbi:MAG: carbon storage regulator CsrA [Candidatus Marinimicrobia bacterium]|nr:carbon storage regulator CsrA [Candidatus Neomarinimicrobiota bacterium]